MKERTEITVKLEDAEEDAVEIVLSFLDRMVEIYEEEDVNEIYVEFDNCKSRAPIAKGVPSRAIQALEEIIGTWL